MSTTVDRPTPIRNAALVTAIALATLWALELLDLPLNQSLNRFGVHAWRFERLWTLLTAPLTHDGLSHVAANSLPLLALGFVVALGGIRRWVQVSLAGTLGSGLFAFCLNTPGTLTVGASGVVFGYLGYLLARSWFTRSVRQLLIAVGVVAVYGGLLLGVLPMRAGISWQAHLGGLMAGGLIAWWLSARRLG